MMEFEVGMGVVMGKYGSSFHVSGTCDGHRENHSTSMEKACFCRVCVSCLYFLIYPPLP